MRSLPRSPTNTSAAPFLRPCANFCAQHSNEVHGHASQKGKSIQRIVYSKKEASGSDASFVVRPSGFEPLAYRVGVIRPSSHKPLWYKALVGIAQISGDL